MFTSEIKETVYVAINLILVAALLSMIAYMMTLRSDFATVANSEISTNKEITAYSEFDKYQGQVLYGEDVLALIREYANSDIAISVDSLVYKNGTKSSFFVNKQKYLASPSSYSVHTLEFSPGISRDATYFSYLVFGKYTENEIKTAKFPTSNPSSGLAYVNYGDVTGIRVRCINNSRRCHISEVEGSIRNIKNGG